MKTNSATVLAAFGICLVISLLVHSAPSREQSFQSLHWGPAVDGLVLSLSAAESHQGDALELQLALRNDGDHDVTLNLGSMLANGKVQLPDSISLNFIDAAGRARTFKFCDKNHSFYVAGRRDDYVVPLRAGSTYMLRLNLDQFWCADTNEFEVKLLPGRNQLMAQFEGTAAQHVNLDMPAIKLMNFWLGKVRSNTLEVEK